MDKKIEPYKGIATIYDEIRPSYPESLIRDIISKTNLKLSEKILEIGAGTGKATIPFAEKGYTIHAIELGKDMAEVLRVKCGKYPNFSLDVASFEEWNTQNNEKYDMIYCAQAFHWLDANIKYKKCHNLLKNNGYLILFWYNTCEDESDVVKEIDEKVEAVLEKYVINYFSDKGKPKRRAHSGISKEDERKAEIEVSGLFEIVEKIEYTREIKNNSEQYLKARKTVPAFATILDGLNDETIQKMDNEIEEIINNHGGYVGTLFNSSLYITKKII